jgi:hypothetical protein
MSKVIAGLCIFVFVDTAPSDLQRCYVGIEIGKARNELVIVDHRFPSGYRNGKVMDGDIWRGIPSAPIS